MTDDTAICHRCGTLLRRGHAELYVVRIEAVADPELADPGPLSPEDLEAEYQRLIEAASAQSEQELLDDVHRRLTLILCTPCYKHWIDHPTP